MFKRSLIILLLGVMLLPGCQRGNRDAPPPSVSSEKSGEKSSGMSRWLGRDVGPQYSWDGQWSGITLDKELDVVFNKTVDVLSSMKFIIDKEETRRMGASANIESRREDKNSASIKLSGKPAGTEVRVKVGTVGDRTGSERILDELQRLLRPAPRKTNAK